MWCWLYLLPCSNNCRPPFVLLSVVDTFLVEVGINVGRFLMISCVLPVKDEMRETLRQLIGVQVWNFSWYQLTTVKLSLSTNFSWNKERMSTLINELILINECIQCFPGERSVRIPTFQNAVNILFHWVSRWWLKTWFWVSCFFKLEVSLTSIHTFEAMFTAGNVSCLYHQWAPQMGTRRKGRKRKILRRQKLFCLLG